MSGKMPESIKKYLKSSDINQQCQDWSELFPAFLNRMPTPFKSDLTHRVVIILELFDCQCWNQDTCNVFLGFFQSNGCPFDSFQNLAPLNKQNNTGIILHRIWLQPLGRRLPYILTPFVFCFKGVPSWLPWTFSLGHRLFSSRVRDPFWQRQFSVCRAACSWVVIKRYILLAVICPLIFQNEI